jgi:mannose-1-phosphate guanylyltransferase/mannose-6-phosphate isomerase
VILSGGSGTRLWPLSTPERPKQFVHFLPGGSLFTQTLRRLRGVDGIAAPVIVTGVSHAAEAMAAAREMGMAPELMIVEPTGRNTAPAALAAAFSVDSNEVLVILPADHVIDKVSVFASAVEQAVDEAGSGSIVTFGIAPTSPETGYGYIEMGQRSGHGFVVERFKEKPDVAEAKELMSDGKHVWNSGMFVVTARVLIEQALIHCPGLLEAVRASVQPRVDGTVGFDEGFRAVESISLDHAIMEKTGKGVVMPIDVGWSDVGSYQALWEVSEKDDAGNSVSGEVVLQDVTGSLIKASSRAVVVAGLSDVVVIETAKAVLVVPRDRAQDVKDLAAEFGGDSFPQSPS